MKKSKNNQDQHGRREELIYALRQTIINTENQLTQFKSVIWVSEAQENEIKQITTALIRCRGHMDTLQALDNIGVTVIVPDYFNDPGYFGKLEEQGVKVCDRILNKISEKTTELFYHGFQDTILCAMEQFVVRWEEYKKNESTKSTPNYLRSFPKEVMFYLLNSLNRSSINKCHYIRIIDLFEKELILRGEDPSKIVVHLLEFR